MAKLSSAIIAAVALFAGAQAASPCPAASRGHNHCGAALVGYGCISLTELATFTPAGQDVTKTIYPVDSNGDVEQPVGFCSGTCVDTSQSTNAHCA